MVGRLALAFLLGGSTALFAQAIPTASRTADVQIGIGYVPAKPDYPPQTYQGYAIYADFDFRPHIGIEGEYHQVFSTTGDKAYQRTYEIGGRYFRTYGPLVPYAKAMYGRGDFNYPYGYTNLGYNMFAGAGGVDVKLTEFIHVRGEYEFQKWISFPNGGLTPQLFTLGVAYHIAGKPRYKSR